MYQTIKRPKRNTGGILNRKRSLSLCSTHPVSTFTTSERFVLLSSRSNGGPGHETNVVFAFVVEGTKSLKIV